MPIKQLVRGSCGSEGTQSGKRLRIHGQDEALAGWDCQGGAYKGRPETTVQAK